MLHNKSAQQFFMVNDMVVKSVPGYLNSLKRCLLCPHEKLRLLITPSQEELLNKWSKLISKCYYVNNYLLANYGSNY